MVCTSVTETIALRDQLVLGDAWDIPLQFKQETAANNCTYAAFDMSTATTVTAEIRNMANDTVLLARTRARQIQHTRVGGRGLIEAICRSANGRLPKDERHHRWWW